MVCDLPGYNQLKGFWEEMSNKNDVENLLIFVKAKIKNPINMVSPGRCFIIKFVIMNRMGTLLTNYLTPLRNLFFPSICPGCQRSLGEGEEVLCLNCLFHLPKTNFHLLRNNPVLSRFQGRVPLKHATSFLFFLKDSLTQTLVHQLKYQGAKEIGLTLGTLLAKDLRIFGWFSEMDWVLPVPLHPLKRRIRGYNQSRYIAEGIGRISQVPVLPEGNFVKIKNTESQTRKGGLGRLLNVENVFKVIEPEMIIGKRILLVDDVLTTGATLEACSLELLKYRPESVSIATLAYASPL